MSPPTSEREVLPTNVKPSHYALVIEPNFETFTFKGVVEISLEVLEATKSISVNAAELTIHEAVFSPANANIVLNSQERSYDEKPQVETFTFGGELPKGKGSLRITFDGRLNDDLRGFYRSKYAVNGEQKYMGVTQFEAVDARRAFPCWDEPAVKATFQLTLVIPKGLQALSNTMPVKETDIENDRKEIVFEPTPIMSTYLLAWVVGEFEHIEETVPKTHKGGTTLVRVFCTPGRTSEIKFALSVATRVLPYFERYYEIDYPLSKSDLIAIPDFSAGAMENWGLVTYRDIRLLCPDDAAVDRKIKVAHTIAHELAHQWFGNLVTMSWWKELWLNEGFARFMEYIATDALFPEWQRWTAFVTEPLTVALARDAMESSHPIEVDVNRAAEVDQIFDAISYAKGGSVIRMLESYMGGEVFRKGLVRYLNRYQYANAETVDLWRALAEESGRDIEKIMANWTREMGYPLLVVQSVGDGKIKVRQERFLSSGPASAENDKVVWQVPLLVRSSDGGDPLPLVVESKECTLEVPGNHSWVLVNAGATAVCRVQYPQELLQELSTLVRAHALPPIDRLTLLSDAAALSKAGHHRSTVVLELLKSYEKETEADVWNVVSGALASIGDLVEEEADLYKAVQNITANLFREQGKKLGWVSQDGEDDRIRLLRQTVITTLCRAEEPEFLEEALKRFKAYIGGDKNAVQEELRGTVIVNGVRHGDASDWAKVKEIAVSSPDPDERSAALGALGTTRVKECLTQTLNLVLGDEIRTQDAYHPLMSVAGNKRAGGNHLTFDFLRAHQDAIIAKLPFMLLGSSIGFVLARFSDINKLPEIEAWWAQVPDETKVRIDRGYATGVENLKNTAAWLARDREALRQYLKE